MARFVMLFNLITWSSAWWFSLDEAPELSIKILPFIALNVAGLITFPRK